MYLTYLLLHLEYELSVKAGPLGPATSLRVTHIGAKSPTFSICPGIYLWAGKMWETERCQREGTKVAGGGLTQPLGWS